jgi:hypothetical protein
VGSYEGNLINLLFLRVKTPEGGEKSETPVKELLQVDIHHVAIALGNI